MNEVSGSNRLKPPQVLFTKCCALGLFVLSIFIYSSVALANTIYVPGNYPTIQEAINAASSGDTVQVAAGTYTETITMISGVVIQGAGQGVSIIDGEGSRGPLVTADGVDSAAKLDGFTITNGKAVSGGGMYITNSSPTVSNCTFSGNSATQNPLFGSGGGMYIQGTSSPVISNCTFSGNDGDMNGGGMFNASSSPLTIENCSFFDNTAHDGGGMYNSNSSPTVSNCTFSGNSATQFSGNGNGGGMYNINSSPTVSNCSFINNNQAYFFGGGIYNYNSSPIVTGCIFSENAATATAGAGGAGMAITGSSSATITNSIFFQNQTLYGGALYLDASSATINNCSFTKNIGSGTIYAKSNSSVTMTNSIMWGDSFGSDVFDGDGTSSVVATYSDIQYFPVNPGTGNISADPMFVDPANGDLHLQQGSFCIDAGNNLVPDMPTTDIDGDNRFIDDPKVADTGNGTPPIVDMGADEFKTFPWPMYLPAIKKKH